VIKINKAGYLYIILTILIGFSAVNTGNNLVYIIASALLSYMMVSGIFGRGNLYGVEIALEFPEELFAKTETPIMVKLTSKRRWMPAFLINVSIKDRNVLFPFVNAKSQMNLPCKIEFDQRGAFHIENIYVSSLFPFNFFTRYRKIVLNTDLIVFPKPVKSHWQQFYDHRSMTRGEVPSSLSGYDSDITSIRDYVFGDPTKYISWKSTAKTGHLKTKELSSFQLQEIMIDFDRMNKDNLEHQISCLTFMIIKLIRSGVPIGIKIRGETHKPDLSHNHKINMLRKLALYV
jgi:uncharacterized protein (DUF58 family)